MNQELIKLIFDYSFLNLYYLLDYYFSLKIGIANNGITIQRKDIGNAIVTPPDWGTSCDVSAEFVTLEDVCSTVFHDASKAESNQLRPFESHVATSLNDAETTVEIR